MKIYVRATQYIYCGTRYDKQAIQILKNSGMCTQQQAEFLIDNVFNKYITAFVHSPNWLEKYLKGIARIIVAECNGDYHKANQFIKESSSIFDEFLTYVLSHRDSLGGVTFDNKFVNTFTYQDVIDFTNDIRKSADALDNQALSEINFKSTSNYELIPIGSYAQMHRMFGGTITGNGVDTGIGCGGVWCHANSKKYYDDYARRGKLFVLANKDYKNIHFDKESNYQNPKDLYGTSLIALVVDSMSGRLLCATLRSNHLPIFGPNAVKMVDHQYTNYKELSMLAGFDVKKAILSNLQDSLVTINYVDISDDTFHIGDKLVIHIDGVGDISATAINFSNDSTEFLFDDIVGESNPLNVNAFFNSLYDKLPSATAKHISSFRLLNASEIYSKCDVPAEWTFLKRHKATDAGQQILYLQHSANRISLSLTPWLCLVSPYNLWAIVKSDGNSQLVGEYGEYGIRPAFTIK